MFRQKYLCVLFVLMMFVVAASGGCGGGGGSSSTDTHQENENNNLEGWDTDPNDNNNIPREPDEPQEPDTPQAPDGPQEPDTPQDPDETQEHEYDISILQGKWTASYGTGTATGNGGTFELGMIHVNAQFSSVRVNGSRATAIASTSAEWDAYRNGVYVTTIYADNNNESIEIRHVSGNVWHYTYPNSNTLTVTITSETTANVMEEGTNSEGYRYTASYKVTKDDPDSPALKYNIGSLQGTWSASSGGGTATGNGVTYELRLSSGSSVSVKNLQVNGDKITGDLDGIIGWNVYLNGTRVRRVGIQYSKLEGQHISGNTWHSPDGNSTMTITSQTTASFFTQERDIEIDGYTYKYFIAFTMTKY